MIKCFAADSYFPQLTANGVKVYMYNPGFIHAKVFLCDDNFLPLYLHYNKGAITRNIRWQKRIDKLLFSVSCVSNVLCLSVSSIDNPAYKLAWVIPILCFPLFGGLLYVFCGNKKPTRKLRRKIEQVDTLLEEYRKHQDWLVKSNKKIINHIT